MQRVLVLVLVCSVDQKRLANRLLAVAACADQLLRKLADHLGGAAAGHRPLHVHRDVRAVQQGVSGSVFYEQYKKTISSN